MKPLRVGLKLLATGAVSLACYSFLLVSSAALAASRRLRGNRTGTGVWRSRIFHAWARCVRRILGMRVEVLGEPPRPPFFLVCNHLSYVDVILLASQVHCVFVAKAEVAGWPVVGRLCGSVDTMFLDRESKRDIPRVMRRMEATLEGGRGVVVFPEGTSSAGEQVLPFRPSLLELPARARLPVSFASISYATPRGAVPARLSVCWWGGMEFGGHLLGLLALPGFRARLAWGEEPIEAPDRKELAKRLQVAVERQFRPVLSGRDPAGRRPEFSGVEGE